jgi:hypothetical protein
VRSCGGKWREEIANETVATETRLVLMGVSASGVSSRKVQKSTKRQFGESKLNDCQT